MVTKISQASPLCSCPSDTICTVIALNLAYGSHVLDLALVRKTKPRDHFVGIAVDVIHFLDLKLPFAVVELIDTNCINEVQTELALRCGSVQEVKEVPTDDDCLAINMNLLNVICQGRVAPGI